MHNRRGYLLAVIDSQSVDRSKESQVEIFKGLLNYQNGEILKHGLMAHLALD
jgi:hypothetical protein